MPFNKLCSPSTPQGWSCTAAWGLNYLMNDCSQRARQSWFWCTYGWIQKCVLSLQKRVLKTKRYSKIFHHYPGTTFFSCHICLYFCQQESRTSPNIIYLFISTSKRSLGFLATELQFQSQEMNVKFANVSYREQQPARSLHQADQWCQEQPRAAPELAEILGAEQGSFSCCCNQRLLMLGARGKSGHAGRLKIEKHKRELFFTLFIVFFSTAMEKNSTAQIDILIKLEDTCLW